jgi:hypothetical protein
VTEKVIDKTYLLKRFLAATIVISSLGYADYITGEISLDILYMLCLCLTTWYTGTKIGLVCVIEIMFAKTTADYFDHIKTGSHVYELNPVIYLAFYLVVCLSIQKLKKIISK